MYKICVYAICKNEIALINQWLECAKEADEIFVLDTGSTDGTYEVLKQSGIKYAQKVFQPFRFDVARNESLRMAPSDCDIYLPLDIDMTLPKGWACELREVWGPEISKLEIPQYYKNSNTSGVWFAHKKNVVWKYPVYEQIICSGKIFSSAKPLIVHNWFSGKSSHNIYLALAELGMKENPKDYYCRYARNLILQEGKTNE